MALNNFVKNETNLKNTSLYSLLFLKCARCRQGAFLDSHPYKISNFNKVKKECPKCQLKYSIEPSFYYGSMYVSYGVGVALAVAVYVILYLLGYGDDPAIAFTAIVFNLILLFPYIGAVSKSIWAHFFFKFDPVIAKQVKDDNNS